MIWWNHDIIILTIIIAIKCFWCKVSLSRGCKVRPNIYSIYTAFIIECTQDIPCLYSTCPCIAGHWGHCSSISLYLNELSPTPILFVAPCQHALGRVQLFQLFLDRSATSTICYKYCQHQRAKFPHGSTDSTYAAGRRGDNVYEVNLWLWQFGRGKPLFGGLSVADTEDRRTELQTDSLSRAVETRKRSTARKGAKWLCIKESRACKDIPCLSHTYLTTTKIN